MELNALNLKVMKIWFQKKIRLEDTWKRFGFTFYPHHVIRHSFRSKCFSTHHSAQVTRDAAFERTDKANFILCYQNWLWRIPSLFFSFFPVLWHSYDFLKPNWDAALFDSSYITQHEYCLQLILSHFQSSVTSVLPPFTMVLS